VFASWFLEERALKGGVFDILKYKPSPPKSSPPKPCKIQRTNSLHDPIRDLLGRFY